MPKKKQATDSNAPVAAPKAELHVAPRVTVKEEDLAKIYTPKGIVGLVPADDPSSDPKNVFKVFEANKEIYSTVDIVDQKYTVGGDCAAYSHDGGTEIVKGYKPQKFDPKQYFIETVEFADIVSNEYESKNCQVHEHAKAVVETIKLLVAALESYEEANKTQC